jgi:hypothetical protein
MRADVCIERRKAPAVNPLESRRVHGPAGFVFGAADTMETGD